MTERETTLLSATPHQLFIGGEWIDAASGGTFPVRDPATGRIVREVADATADDAIRALDAAVAAQEPWAATAPPPPSHIHRAAREHVQHHSADMARLKTVEMGKPKAQARGEVP
ncbi:aldehyde dehydrogenase family protein, partial [Nocardia gipuzkoensis]|uniref:aldehyde dehydrogenase family protein n=1 Tax=Nocardia gipuzkoensis TaxID=2749991 RepID=UPI002456408D